jgi:WD40 repeat protein
VFSGHFGSVTSLSLCPSGRYVSTASEDSSVRIWDVASGKQAAVLGGHSGPVYGVDYR